MKKRVLKLAPALLALTATAPAFALEHSEEARMESCVRSNTTQNFAEILRSSTQVSKITQAPAEKPIQLADTIQQVGTAGNIGIYLVTKIVTDKNGNMSIQRSYQQGPIGLRTPGLTSGIRTP